MVKGGYNIPNYDHDNESNNRSSDFDSFDSVDHVGSHSFDDTVESMATLPTKHKFKQSNKLKRMFSYDSVDSNNLMWPRESKKNNSNISKKD